MAFRDAENLNPHQAKLMKGIGSFPKEFKDFCHDLLMDEREKLEFGGGRLVYNTAFVRWVAVSNFLDRFNGKSVKDLAVDNGCTVEAIVKRLDKLRDIFVCELTGGWNKEHRGRAASILRQARWHDDDISAVLRNSKKRLEAYSRWL